jgi:hypothetical protein
MFILDGKPLSPDVAFTTGGIQYPANWLRLASPEEREAIGITEVPDPEPYDQRFYWGPGLPKDHVQLVEQWGSQTRTTAGTLLQPSDWLVIRETDNGTAVPEAWRTWRESIRTATGDKVAAIEATLDTEELAAYITGADYPTWPLDPDAPVVLPAADGLEPAGDQPEK